MNRAPRRRLPAVAAAPGLAALILIPLLLAVPEAAARRYAIVAGSNLGGPELDSLRFAESDARRMAEVLTSLGGFAPGDVEVIAPCDSASLERSLTAMQERLSGPEAADGLFLFYYSGHSNGAGLRLRSKTYPLERLRERFQAVPSQVKIGVFDACQSGLYTRFKGGRAGRPISLESLKNIRGQVIISSSAMDEKSQESDQLQGSVFTHHWLNGLRGSADLSGDRRVTLGEAYQYAYQMTVSSTSRTRFGIQHPAYQFRIHGEGDLVLADLNQGRSGLLFRSALEGKYLVMDRDQDRLLADFHKPAGKELLIALAPGDYRVHKVERDQWRMAEARVPDSGSLDFEPSSLQSQPQVANLAKGPGGYPAVPGASGPGPSGMGGGHEATRLGAARRWGASLKMGEGTEVLGLALIHNLAPHLQLQAGASFPGSLVLPMLEDFRGNSYFALLRQYQGLYFIDGGLNLKSTKAVAADSGGQVSKTGWEMGLPVHVGVEIGPRRSVFATLSLGYLWVFTGGGDVLSLRAPAGTVSHARTAESGVSFGAALGMYLF